MTSRDKDNLEDREEDKAESLDLTSPGSGQDGLDDVSADAAPAFAPRYGAEPVSSIINPRNEDLPFDDDEDFPDPITGIYGATFASLVAIILAIFMPWWGPPFKEFIGDITTVDLILHNNDEIILPMINERISSSERRLEDRIRNSERSLRGDINRNRNNIESRMAALEADLMLETPMMETGEEPNGLQDQDSASISGSNAGSASERRRNLAQIRELRRRMDRMEEELAAVQAMDYAPAPQQNPAPYDPLFDDMPYDDPAILPHHEPQPQDMPDMVDAPQDIMPAPFAEPVPPRPRAHMAAELQNAIETGGTALQAALAEAGIWLTGSIESAHIYEDIQHLAEDGIMGMDALKAEFDALMPELIASARASDQQGWRRTVVEEANRLITIRRSADTQAEGDSAEDILARAEGYMREGDLLRTLDMMESLPPETGQHAQTWMEAVWRHIEARDLATELRDIYGNEG